MNLRRKAAVLQTQLSNCQNCGSEVSSKFCPDCGQDNSTHSLSLKAFATEAFNEQLGFDAKVWRTLRLLFTQPGFLTQEFVAGRRVRYMTPFKTYLLASFLFFFVLSYMQSARLNPTADSKNPFNVSMTDRPIVKPGSLELPKKSTNPEFAETLARKMAAKAQNTDTKAVLGLLMANMPKAMFFLLPIFALLLQLAFWGGNRWYIEHLIFGLHGHAFMFFALTVVEILPGRLGQLGKLLVVMIVIPVYWYVAMLRFYGQGKFITLVKNSALALIYGTMQMIAIICIVILSLVLN